MPPNNLPSFRLKYVGPCCHDRERLGMTFRALSAHHFLPLYSLLTLFNPSLLKLLFNSKHIANFSTIIQHVGVCHPNSDPRHCGREYDDISASRVDHRAQLDPDSSDASYTSSSLSPFQCKGGSFQSYCADLAREHRMCLSVSSPTIAIS
jgi:hypothetical protein